MEKNNTGTDTTAAKTAGRKRYAVVNVFGNAVTKNVLVRIPTETNSFMKLIPGHLLENGRKVSEHYKHGKKVYSSDKNTSVVMNMHFYGFAAQHLGKSMVCDVKIVRMTRTDGKTFVHLDIYRQKAGTQAERILTITNEGDKGILVNGTDARILFIKAQPRTSKTEASAEAGTETKPETLAKETAPIKTEEAPLSFKERKARKHDFKEVNDDDKGGPRKTRSARKPRNSSSSESGKPVGKKYYANNEPQTIEEAEKAGYVIDDSRSSGRQVVLVKDGNYITRFLPKEKTSKKSKQATA